MNDISRLWIVISIALTVFPLTNTPAEEADPVLRPIPNEIPAPEDNPTTADKVALGRRLFFDPRLSGDNTISCATCHQADLGWADGMATGKGSGGQRLSRNTPTVLNSALHRVFLWDGRVSSLEEQSLGPIQMPSEMNQDVDGLIEELAGIAEYADAFESVFGKPVNAEDLARALAAFERTLITRNSPLDRYLAGDRNALSDLAKEGLRLFRGEAGCIECHNGPLLSDDKFYRLGIRSSDLGRGAVTGKREDNYKFRTPTLRDVARTAPYMHNGSLKTLYDVVEFYYRGVPSRGPEGLPLDVTALTGQSFTEIDALVAFLESLSGELPAVDTP